MIRTLLGLICLTGVVAIILAAANLGADLRKACKDQADSVQLNAPITKQDI